VGLEHIARQVEPDRDNLRHDRPPFWIIAVPRWHIDAVGGAGTSSAPLAGAEGLAHTQAGPVRETAILTAGM
jgi:hypothetical protein